MLGIRISIEPSGILTEAFPGFPLLLQENGGIVHRLGHGCSQILPNSFFTNWHYAVWGTNSVVKEATKLLRFVMALLQVNAHVRSST
jgi:hypothetical protein